MHPPQLKIVILGSHGSGKTSLLNCYTSDDDNKDFTDSLFLTCEKEILFNHERITLNIQDSKGGETYFYHRLPLLREADVVLIAFSLGCRASYLEAFDTVRSLFEPLTVQFYKEYAGYARKAPVVFVGCKSDLLQDMGCIARLKLMDEPPLSKAEAPLIGGRISNLRASYAECSTKDRIGVEGVFELAVNAWLSFSAEPVDPQEFSIPRGQPRRNRHSSFHSRFTAVSPPRMLTILK
ncbi:hypothetical protein L0F63_002994, partial [Massospora cicadina]